MRNTNTTATNAASARDPAALPARSPITAGSTLAGYRIDKLLGEGGMGAVYLATREVGAVTRTVALKTMHRVRPQPLELARFAAEQQTLAKLHHPYIAAFVDVGVDADSATPGVGTPFFAMEFVPGLPITQHCDANALSPAARIDLWLKVCDAVQYAHRNLVVHRDIKPANVLVSDDGLPKLLDFGVAKLLTSGGNEMLTTEFERHLTLDYASPERILRSTSSTAEDVYALGVLLFELLVGLRPFRRSDKSYAALAQTLEREHAAPPIQCFGTLDEPQQIETARRRGVSIRQLRAVLASDLAAVLDRALHPDVRRRYQSVEQLVDDVRRWQRGLPVQARGDSQWYRARRFIGRHKLALTAGVLSASALLLALVVSTVQTRVAHDQARRAAAVSGFLQELLAAPSARWDTKWRGSANVTMAEVLGLASKHLQTDLHDQPAVRVELYGSLARAYAALGRNSDAVAQQRRALEIALQATPADEALQIETRTALATTLDYLRTPAALREARAHLVHVLAWLDRNQPGPGLQRAIALGELGVNYRAAGDLRSAASYFQRAMTVYEQAGLPADHPLAALGYGLLGGARMELREFQAARGPLEKAVAIYDANLPRATADAAIAYGHRAFLHLIAGEYKQAAALVHTAKRISIATTGAASIETANVLVVEVPFDLLAGAPDQARSALSRATALLRGQPPLTAHLQSVLTLTQAEVAIAAGNHAAALPLLAACAELRGEHSLRRASSYDPGSRWLAAQGRALRLAGHDQEAVAVLRAAHARRAALVGQDSPYAQLLLAEIARAETQPARN